MRQPIAAVLAVALIAAGGAAQAQNSPAAQQVFDRARAASGGASGWNALRGVHEVGEEGGEAFERWLDPLRYGMREETPAPGGGELVQAYNGAAEWRVLAGGVLTGSDQGEFVARVRSEAFFSVNGYFFPSRYDLRSSHIGVRERDGRSFDVLRVQPAGGVPRELWFDRRTGLLGVMIETVGDTQVTTELSDYRKVGRVMAPFKLSIREKGAAPRVRILKSVDFRPADRDQFSLPPPKTPPPAKRGH